MTMLVCRSMRDMMSRVCIALVQSGDVRFISELSNRTLVIALLQKFGPEILQWCSVSKLNVVHLIHPDIHLDWHLCELILRLTSGIAYELLPSSMRSNMDVVQLSLRESCGLTFKVLEDSLQTAPVVCRLCIHLLGLEESAPVPLDECSSFLLMRLISDALQLSKFPRYDTTDPLYHRRTNKHPELTLVRSLAAGDVGWRYSCTA